MKVNYNLQWLLLIMTLLSMDCRGRDILDPRLYHLVREFALRLIGKTTSEPRLLGEAIKNRRIQAEVPQSMDFPCRFIESGEPTPSKRRKFSSNTNQNEEVSSSLPMARSLSRPSSVHALRPGDIDIIAALGDSLTAGNGAAASNLLHVITENRGVSWSIGGQGTWREYLTLPNILKVFNPKLIGYSLRDSLSFQNASQFNVGEIMAMSRDMPYMAKLLIRRMRHDPRVNIDKDWKLVTIMIGANDFCSNVCYLKKPRMAPYTHRKELLETLLILKNNLPRTFVNLVPVPHLDVLRNMTGTPPACEITHLVECPCLFGETHKPGLKMMTEIMENWQQIDLKLENAPELNDKDDFAVVVQPFDVNIKFPKKNGVTDYSFMSTDCFHFSQKGYAWTSNALWNNMLQPPGKKQLDWNEPFKPFLCPTKEFPYIYTLKNAKRRKNSTQE